MSRQDFAQLVASGLLSQVEQIVVEGHRTLYSERGLEWSPPIAYQWLHYEDPFPVERLADGTRRLRHRGVAFSAEAVDKACLEASRKGFLSSK